MSLPSEPLNNKTQAKRQILNTQFFNLDGIESLNNSSGGFCTNLIEIITSSDFGKGLLNTIYPLLYGKIFYTPKTPIYDKIIQRMNSTFESINQFINGNSSFDTIISYADDLNKILQNISINNDFNSQLNNTFNNQTFSDLFNQTLGSLISQNFGNLTTNLNQILMEFTDPLSQNLRYIKTVNKFIKNILSCIDLNRFYGYLNENDAVNDAMNVADYNIIWAVIVFDDNSTTELPDKITYKIRMIPYNTHTTSQFKDKIYKYGPNNCNNCLIDFSLGYIYIQELVESSIIEERTNETYNFAVKTQMTPYPCYTSDDFIGAISQSLPLFMVLGKISL